MVTKIEDSIAHIQVPKNDEDLEFFMMNLQTEKTKKEVEYILPKNKLVSNE